VIQAYEGQRDFSSLSAFAKEHLTKVYCSIRSIETCSDEEKAMISELRSKSKEELDAIVTDTAERTTAASEKYEKAIEELQSTYERVTEEYHTESEKIRKESNIKWVNQIIAADFPDSATDGAEDEL
jgi:di/tripeptidase